MSAPSAAVFKQVWEELAKDLRDEGLTVKFVDGWKSRGAGTFLPRAFVEHHTASNKDSGNAPALGICTWGRDDIPGPLCNILFGRDGTVFFVAAGKANHAGIGGPNHGIPADSANTYALGGEIENNGIGEPYPAKQMDAVLITTGVLVKRMKRSAYFAFAHKEWTARKIDPSFAMAAFRKRLSTVMKNLGQQMFVVVARKTVPGGKKSMELAKGLRKRGFSVTREKKR